MEEAKAPRHTNRLAQESSPYLQQHAHNPVDWWSWGPEALERARREERPILLSIGYSACHWCHVMEVESFESEEIAALMNRDFVCVKVDREERPDLDHVYQLAHQIMSHRAGGWPLTMFLFPDGRPFFGGTYFPPGDRHGMPGFPRILGAVAEAWRTRRAELEGSADEAARAIETVGGRQQQPGVPAQQGLADAAGKLAVRFDRRNGGFGDRPKFPNTLAVSLLLRHHEASRDGQSLEMVKLALAGMMEGGIHDHLGGGFHRYSVDERWLVPHFEKMLYDNALLVSLYLDGHRATGVPEHARTVRDVLAWALREMTSPDGAFYSTIDADSEGEEGKFYVWTPAQVSAIVGEEDAEAFCLRFGVTPAGNFEHGTTVLHLNRPVATVADRLGRPLDEVAASIERARRALLEARESRPRPFRDEKILSSWNGLMLSALADAAACLGDPGTLASAVRAARFFEERMLDGERLCRVFMDGAAKIDGFVDDYAFLARGMLDLYEASLDPHWLELSRRLASALVTRFWDDASGTLYFTAEGAEKLVTRPVDSYDGAVPSGTSVAAHVFLRLAVIDGDDRWARQGERIVRASFGAAADNPFGFSNLLAAADLLVRGAVEVAIAAEPGDPAAIALAGAASRRLAHNRVTHLVDERDDPLGRKRAGGRPAAYVCRGRSCSAPVTDPEGIAAAMSL